MPCSICLQSKRFYQEIRELKCGHRFHEKCIISWTQNHTNCPLCRIQIKKQNPIKMADVYLISKNKHPIFTNINEYHKYLGLDD